MAKTTNATKKNKKNASATVKKKAARVRPPKKKVQVAVGQSVTVSFESVLILVDTTETYLLRRHTSTLAFEDGVQGQGQG